jgi:hypothetical protein
MPIPRVTSSALLRLGFIALLIRNVLHVIIDRTGRTSDFSDFAEGVFLGIAAAAILMAAWRNGRGGRIGGCTS